MTGSSSSTAVFVAGSLLVAGLGFGLMSFSNKPTSESTLTEIDDDEQEHADYITADEVAKVFDRLFLEMQATLAALMQQIQQIQMSGQMIPEQQIKKLLRNEMERALLAKQTPVLEEFDMDYDCLEEATWEFLEKDEEYPQVKKAVERFQKLWESTTGEPVIGWRRGQAPHAIKEEELLSPERTIEVADKFFSAITNHMRVLVGKFKTQGLNVQDVNVQQQLQMEFSQTANDAGEAALESEGVTLAQFESSVKEHGNNPTVGRALGMLQMKQQQDLLAMTA